MKKNTQKNSGFTLIELLVVISIIGVLSSVVLASLSSARLKAQDAVVKETVAQMEILLAQEYSDTGSYRGLQAKNWDAIGGATAGVTTCSQVFPPDTNGSGYNYSSPYKNEMIKLCEQIVKYAPTSPNGAIQAYFAVSTAVAPSRYNVYSIAAYLPSSGYYWCAGSGGKSDSGTPNPWNNSVGCYNNP